VKKLELKKVKSKIGEFDYKEQLIGIMEVPLNQNEGARIDEIRKSMRVIDVLEKAEGVLELEDADYTFMKEKVLSIGFKQIDHVVLDFLEEVSSGEKAQ
jgi:hypothetical protein